MSKQKSFTRTVAKAMAALMVLAVVLANPLIANAGQVVADWVGVSGQVSVGESLYFRGITPIRVIDGEDSSNVGSNRTIAQIPTVTPGQRGVFSHIGWSDDLVNWHILVPNVDTNWAVYFNGYYYFGISSYDGDSTSHRIVRSDLDGNNYIMDNLPATSWTGLQFHGDFFTVGSTFGDDAMVWISEDGTNWSEVAASTLEFSPLSLWDAPVINGESELIKIAETSERTRGVMRGAGFLGRTNNNDEISMDVINIYHDGQLLGSLTNNALINASVWAVDSIEIAYDLGLGIERFWSHTLNATRLDFAALAVEIYELFRGEIEGRETFNDTANEFVQKAAYIGIVTGMSEGVFSPHQYITREQAAVMLARLATALGIELPQTTTIGFADSADISDWALEAVGQVNNAGIMLGVSDTEFNPGGNFTREQTIVTILRIHDELQ